MLGFADHTFSNEVQAMIERLRAFASHWVAKAVRASIADDAKAAEVAWDKAHRYAQSAKALERELWEAL